MSGERQLELLDGSPGRSFHNTISLKGEELVIAAAQARTQEERILAFFRSRPGRVFTPEDLLAIMPLRTPITSVRRAMTNLTRDGLLAKVPLEQRRVRGKLGKPVHSWRFA
jgi:hypothetical protein